VQDSAAQGIKRKKMGVVFKNLTVVGEGADATSIPNLFSPIESAWQYINPLNWYFSLFYPCRVFYLKLCQGIGRVPREQILTSCTT
jgi:hypothetical protein